MPQTDTDLMQDLAHASPQSQRLGSLDAYRGFVMFLMMAEVLHLSRMAGAFPDSGVWGFLAFHQGHVPWIGCSLHDMIQPSFSFLVGVALPFSLASRSSRGQSHAWMTWHACVRAGVLVVLGIFLRSVGSSQTNSTFEDTLTQIGLGYAILYWLGLRSTRTQWIALGVILVGYWAAFALYPLPGDGFDTAAVGVSTDWPHRMTGFAAHWNKNTNLAWAVDTWFMNLFPRVKAFTHNGGGYATLSFIPTLGTMLLGLLAGNVLRSPRTAWGKIRWFLCAGILGLGAGWLLNATGLCPVVKRIWTPSWALFSGGWCFVFLAAFYLLIDVWRLRGWSTWLQVIGLNSIFAYCMAHLWEGFIRSTFETHLGKGIFARFGDNYEALFSGAFVLAVYWLILWWMARHKLFVKI
jgi:heparan-alpha-glucosaminide N-acetyltransferase